MPRTVAVLSDVHGVLPVLEAVLAEKDVQEADLVVVTGDHAAGPQPVEVLDRLTGLANGLLVRGNADRELVTLVDGGPTLIPDPIAPWAAAQLRPDQVELLRNLPHPVVVDDVDGFGSVLFCHGSPRDDDEVVLVDTRIAAWPDTVMPSGQRQMRMRPVQPGAGGGDLAGDTSLWLDHIRKTGGHDCPQRSESRAAPLPAGHPG